MSGYVIVGYSVTTVAIAGYIAWIVARTRTLRSSLYLDLTDKSRNSS